MILVIGAGVAGLSCALAAVAGGAEVELVTPGRLRDGADALVGSTTPQAAAERALAGGNTAMAQGGVAAAVGPGDTVAAHLADTLAAGAGLVDKAAARVLVTDGARIVSGLLASGLPVDRRPDGGPLLGLEGAHGRPRILHSGGDRTGAALHAFLAERVLAAVDAGSLVLTESARVESLLVGSGAVIGAALRSGGGMLEHRGADAVVVATGGYAGMFARNTNHAGALGEGILVAARAGALVSDLEFVQFHPTALSTGELVSEAVRGAGAVLRDAAGRRIMEGRHPLGDLAPRDVVARELHRALSGDDDNVFLDATGIERDRGAGALGRMFPGISAAVAAAGLDWAHEPIPVAPAAHYTMGGVASDLDGRSTLPGLFVAGEVASTGVHGANRLASNSLLEGLVFGERAGTAAASFVAAGAARWGIGAALAELARDAESVAPMRAVESGGLGDHFGAAGGGVAASRTRPVDEAITAHLGIERDADGLAAAARVFAKASEPRAELAALVCASALSREESRGAHQRTDFPELSAQQARRRGFAIRSLVSEPSPRHAPQDHGPNHDCLRQDGQPTNAESLTKEPAAC